MDGLGADDDNHSWARAIQGETDPDTSNWYNCTILRSEKITLAQSQGYLNRGSKQAILR